MKVYDASNQILGRLSTVIAKQLLKDEKVFVVNCEKAVISGNPRYTTGKYSHKSFLKEAMLSADLSSQDIRMEFLEDLFVACYLGIDQREEMLSKI